MIGATIKSILYNNGTLTSLVPNTKIFPYVMDPDTAMPFMVYTIDSVDSEYSKAGWERDVIEFSVMSFATTYPGLQPIVSAIRSAMEFNRTGYGTQVISNIYLTGFDEGFILETNAFYNKLTFKTEIKTY